MIGFCQPQLVRSIRIAAPHLTFQVAAFILSYLLAPHTVMGQVLAWAGELDQATKWDDFRSSACDIVLMEPYRAVTHTIAVDKYRMPQ